MRLWPRAFLAAIVLVAFSGSAWAMCAEGAIASDAAQMACCQMGHDQCPMKDSAAGCCQTAGPRIPAQATVVKAAPLQMPDRTVIVWVIVPALSSVPQARPLVSSDPSPPSALSPPAYILFSTLLI